LQRLLLGLTVLALLALSGCASLREPDPFEKVNRKVFAFNDAVDDAVIRPAAELYLNVAPRPVRIVLNNFFSNVRDAWSAFNLLLQGRVIDATSDMLRFTTNTGLGLFGMIDIATEIGLERHGEDFGMTLGRWGFPAGAYIVWPILGPSTVRDSIGLPVDVLAVPDPFISGVATRNVLTATRIISTRANLLKATRVLDDIALDRYSFVRDAYLQRRRSLIYNGEPPDAGGVRYDLPDTEPAPPDAAASAPPAGPAAAPSAPAEPASSALPATPVAPPAGPASAPAVLKVDGVSSPPALRTAAPH
jgi:phospholipid-binding lipoprotein MlaA